ncbi:Zonadhesin, partial [Ophiophagus hannah]
MQRVSAPSTGLQCQPHSRYNPCMSACPPSCSDLAAPASCSSPCLEGCECEPGYVLSGYDCVPFRDCGCSFLGKYYKAGDHFMTDDCSQNCVCMDSSSLFCKEVSCPQDHRCGILNLTRGCYRANPCQPNSCFNNGTCVLDESPDTFHCECPENYEGLLCEIQVTPEVAPQLRVPSLPLHVDEAKELEQDAQGHVEEDREQQRRGEQPSRGPVGGQLGVGVGQVHWVGRGKRFQGISRCPKEK